ncbi:prepilin peptidase [Microvirga sp. 2YAF29]|uniref:prepilin peptidase n=1 Tax=Microvirga sp. 2YAF29 TaxID=3233031 RepID=UPI003F9BA98B
MMTAHHLTLLATGYLAVVLLVCTWVDIRRMIVPNAANMASLAGALAFAALSARHSLPIQILGGLIGGALFLTLAALFKRARHYDGLGLGDTKFIIGAGTWVGWQGLAPLIFAASSSALAYAALQQAKGSPILPTTRIPFAPFLSLATLTVWCWQEFGDAPWML